MKSILHTLLFILLASIWSSTVAQEYLVTPSNADIIVTMRGSNLLDKVSLNEMKEIPSMNDMFKGLTQMLGEENTEIENLGIDPNANAEYFISFKEEGLALMGVSFKVNDPQKFKSVFMKDLLMFNDSGIDLAITDGYTKALSGTKGLITYSVLAPSYEDPYRGWDDVIIDNTEVEEIDPWSGDEIVEEFPVEEVPAEELEIEEEEHFEIEETPADIEEEFDEILDGGENENTLSYYEEMELEETQKKEEMANISKAYAIELLTNPNSTKATPNSKKIDSEADFSILVNSYSGIYQFFYNNTTNYFYRNPIETQMSEMMENIYGDFEWLSMNGYYKKDELRVEMHFKLKGDLANWYDKMLNSDFNDKMLNYIPYNDHIGYVSGTFNTKELIQGYYNYVDDIFNSMPEMEGESIGETASIIVDFVELFLDEEAVAQLLEGDYYAGITDINSYEVEYTTYEYDDEWNYTEVTKTKEEVRPDFLIMFTSDDQKNIENIFRLIEISTNGLFKNEGSYYKLASDRNIPLDVYTMQKEGIVFIFTSQALFDFIQKGGKKPSSSQKALISNNSSVMQLDGATLANKIPLTDMPSDLRSMIEFFRENAGNMTIKQGKMKDNILSADMTMSVEGEHKNSLAYFLHLINGIAQLEKNNSTYRN